MKFIRSGLLPSLIIFLLLKGICVFSQETDIYTKFIIYNTDDGLSNNRVLDIEKDQFGFIWFTTTNGLSRFDGSEFTNYFHDKDDPNSLSDNLVTCITEDYNGNLWIGTANGLNCYNRDQDYFIRYKHIPDSNSLSDNHVRAIACDSTSLWIETSNMTLSRYDFSGKHFESYTHSGIHIEGDYFNYDIVINKGIVFLTGRAIGSWSFSKDKKKFSELKIGVGTVCKSNGNNLIYISADGKLWKCDSLLVDLGIQTIRQPYSASVDKFNRIWVGGGNSKGLACADLNNGKVKYLSVNSNNSYSLPNYEINEIMTEPDGVWVGTSNGVAYLNYGCNNFRHYRKIEKNENSLSVNKTTCAVQDGNNTLWIGTQNNGLDTMNLKSEIIGNVKFQIINRNISRKVFDQENELIRDYLFCYYQDYYSSNKHIGKDTIDKISSDYNVYKNSSLIFNHPYENNISTLFKDYKGNIWAGTWGCGATHYNTSTKNIKKYILQGDRFYNIAINPLFACNWCSSFCETKNGEIVYGSWEGLGLNFIDIKKQEFTGKHYIRNSIPKSSYLGTYNNKDSLVWINTKNALFKYNIYNNKYIAFGCTNFSDEIYKKYIRKYVPDSYLQSDNSNGDYRDKSIDSDANSFKSNVIIIKGKYWMGCNSGLLKYNPENANFEYFPVETKKKSDFKFNKIIRLVPAEDSTGIWLSTAKGIVQYKIYKNLFVKYPQLNQSIFDSLYYPRPVKEIKDTLYIITKNVIVGYSLSSRHIEYFKPKSDSISNINVSSYQLMNNELWFISNNGINIFNFNSKKHQSFEEKTGIALENNYVKCLYIPNDSILWYCDGQGVNCLNLHSKSKLTFKADELNPNSIITNNVNHIGEDSLGNIWLNSKIQGLCKLDPKTGIVDRLGSPASDQLANRLIKALLTDSKGNIWAGTSEGWLQKLVVETDSFRHYRHQAWDSLSFRGKETFAIAEDSTGIIWIGTDKGLNRYDEKNDCFYHYSVEDGLADKVVVSLVVDYKNRIWIGTQNGLSCLDTSRTVFINFYKEDGLQGNEFTKTACNLNDNRLVFGGNNGFNIFHPDSVLQNNQEDLKVVLYDFAINGSVYFPFIKNNQELILKYFENDISLKFVALDYVTGKDIKYRFRLKNLQDEWNYANAESRYAYYYKIPSGKYEFQLQYKTPHNDWNDNVISIQIQIQPPWWTSWWFIAICTFLLVIIVILVIKIRERNLRATKKHLEETVSERTRDLEESNAAKNQFFAILSHDLRNPVKSLEKTSNQLLGKFNKLNDNEKMETLTIIKETSSYTNTLLENLLLWSVSQKGILKPDKDEFRIEPLIINIIQSFSSQALDKKIKLDYQCDDLTIYSDKRIVETVLRNLLSNAINYTNTGSVSVSVDQDKLKTRISITDTGVGIPESLKDELFSFNKRKTEKNSGFGLILCGELIDKLGAEIKVDSIPGKGSAFVIIL